MFKSVGIVARYDKSRALALVDELAEHLKEKGLKVFVEDTLADKTKTEIDAVRLERMRTDFIVTIGGDGTILRTCVTIPKPEPPILAVNMGVRGFLTEVEPRNALEAIDKCLQGKFSIEKCMKLKITADDMTFPEPLNEAVMLADEPTRIVYSRILKNKESILNCQADGLMVSTQTGSTGYSLSAGGPVLDPDVDAFVLTPLCALTPFRPIVFPADTILTVEVEKPQKILVIIDGKHRQAVRAKHPSLTVTRSKNVTSFIRLEEDFYHRLKSRLLFKGTS